LSSIEVDSVNFLDHPHTEEGYTNMCDRLRAMHDQSIHNNDVVSIALSRILHANANCKIECMICREQVFSIPSCLHGRTPIELNRDYYHMRSADGSNLLMVPEHVIVLDAGQLIQASYWHDIHSSGMSRGIVSANGGVCGECYRTKNKLNSSNLADAMCNNSDVFARNKTSFLNMKIILNGFSSIKVNTSCTCTEQCTLCMGKTYESIRMCNKLDLAKIFQPMWIQGDVFGSGLEVWVTNLHAVSLFHIHKDVLNNIQEVKDDSGATMTQVQTVSRYHDKLHDSCVHSAFYSNKKISCGSCGGGIGATKIHCFEKFFHPECVQWCHICRVEFVPRIGASKVLHGVDSSAKCVRLACSRCWNGIGAQDQSVTTTAKTTVKVYDNKNSFKRVCIKRVKVEEKVLQPIVYRFNEDAKLPFLSAKRVLPVESEDMSWEELLRDMD
jgi:hypothetical protein